jgi:hypothetical protein
MRARRDAVPIRRYGALRPIRFFDTVVGGGWEIGTILFAHIAREPHAPNASIVFVLWNGGNAMTELIEQLATLEKLLHQEQTNLVVSMAKQPGEIPLSVTGLSRISCIHGALEAVRTELAARLPRVGFSP